MTSNSEKRHSFGLRSGQGDYSNSEFSSDSEVLGKASCTGSFLRDTSKIIDESTVRDSDVSLGSVVCGKAFVKGSLIINSVISGGAYICNSYIKDSVVCENARVHNSTVVHSRIWGNADLQSVKAPQAFISGNSCIATTELDYGTIIESGFWGRAPKVFICKSGFTVCEAKGSNVIVSCTNNSADKWLSGAGRRYGKMLGLKDEEIDEIQGYVEHIRDMRGKDE